MGEKLTIRYEEVDSGLSFYIEGPAEGVEKTIGVLKKLFVDKEVDIEEYVDKEKKGH